MVRSRFPNRRDVLQFGALGACGLSLPALLQGRAEAARCPAGRAKACILLFHFGGPSHHDTFDMKPLAPAGIRGEFRPIATSVPGYRVCEHLPTRSGPTIHRIREARPGGQKAGGKKLIAFH